MSITLSHSRKESLTTKARTGSLITVFNDFSRFSNEIEDYVFYELVKWKSRDRRICSKFSIHATSRDRVFEWIPYDQLIKFEVLGKGGFGVVQRATWVDGQIDQIIGWNYLQNRWERHGKTRVAVKILDNSRKITVDFFTEIIPQIQYEPIIPKSLMFHLIRYLGISKNPATQNYAIVMQYAEGGNLRNYLEINYSTLTWEKKLFMLQYIAEGLKILHEEGLLHRNLHSSNILIHNDIPLMGDVGLCRPVDKLIQSDEKEIYGIMPFMAPELLKTGIYTKEVDIYSFGSIMWEICEHQPPFNKRPHNDNLAMEICLGERPLIEKETPESLAVLIKKCWDSNPNNRPTANELFFIIKSWYLDLLQESPTEYYFEFKAADKIRKDMLQTMSQPCSIKNHSEAHYRSRKFNFTNFSMINQS
ncbi:3109_t:CDS:2 [Cetraspora pellucida]|uniref:3109_t:CDS:1 n=1 Tax=Cetraspora pellucida TaxID=1433469 RepID=A0A9N9FH73_9GLOM|nr:3109_t:CDS:2 [Cetraspora pellucida]